MVDFKEVKNAKSLHATVASKDELEILSHQSVDDTVRVAQDDVSHVDIKRQMDHTYMFPQPEGDVLKLTGYISKQDVQAFWLNRNVDDDKPAAKQHKAKVVEDTVFDQS